MNKPKKLKSVTTLSPEARSKEIRALEFERKNITSSLEMLLDEMRKAGLRPAPRRRKYRVGHAPHDYKGK